MDFLSGLNIWGGGWTGWFVPFVFVLSVIVFFHELGHFLVARWCGVRVLTFSIGFGPELIGFNDRHGTRWKFSAIPLGGYVKFFGDENAASVPDHEAASQMSEAEKRESFVFKPVGQRAAIVVAGPLANFILAIVIFAAVFTFYGHQATPARVDAVQPGSAAQGAGFQQGDLIVSINGRKMDTFLDMQRFVSTAADQELEFEVDRSGKIIKLRATPKLTEQKDHFGNVHRRGLLGISGLPEPPVPVNPLTAVKLGAKETWFVVERTLAYLGGVIVGRESADQLGGPIRIAQVAGQVATIGFIPILNLAALLSVSIGLLNLFPVPLLDGGHLLFYAIEALRGRPLSERAQEYGFRFGLAVVLLLMFFATYNDVVQWWMRL
jgi:regulator of sigma E protease